MWSYLFPPEQPKKDVFDEATRENLDFSLGVMGIKLAYKNHTDSIYKNFRLFIQAVNDEENNSVDINLLYLKLIAEICHLQKSAFKDQPFDADTIKAAMTANQQVSKLNAQLYYLDYLVHQRIGTPQHRQQIVEACKNIPALIFEMVEHKIKTEIESELQKEEGKNEQRGWGCTIS